jgi:bla regulator protein blaR1
MLQWLFYVLVVTIVLASAAWPLERALRGRHWQTRWVWVTAMGLTVLLAYLSATPLAFPAPRPSLPLQSWHTIQHIAPVRLPQLISANGPWTAHTEAIRGNTAFAGVWLALSASLALMLVASGVSVLWRRRRWPLRLLCSTCVSVASDFGPAVVGLLRPTIVIPSWVLESAAAEQQLIIAHEQSHLDARDPLLLTGALGTLILMPWNLPLWWLLHRLRHAIEVDCDTRVLRKGHDVQAYGEALIEAGQRRGAFMGAVAAMSESRTLLEKRIEIMTQHSRKPWTYGFAACCLLSGAIAAGATQIVTPDATANRPNAQAVLNSINSYNLIRSDGLLWTIPVHRGYWSNARSYCNESTIGDRLNWRLPTAAEAIRFYAKHAKSLPRYWEDDYIWTSTAGPIDASGVATHVVADSTINGIMEDDHYRGLVTCVHEIGP